MILGQAPPLYLGIKSEDRVQHLECCRCDGCATCMLDCGSLVIVMLTVIE